LYFALFISAGHQNIKWQNWHHKVAKCTQKGGKLVAKVCIRAQKFFSCTPKKFVLHTKKIICTAKQQLFILSLVLHTFSTFGTISNTFTSFGTVSQVLTHFLKF